jgi:cobalt-zinc-cadmium efflux system protein
LKTDTLQHRKEKKLLISIFLNISITLAQVIGGVLSGSLALLSDALHNFSDVISLVISFAAKKIGKKKASASKTFGFKRAEILAAFINAATLLVVAVLLIIEAIHRFQDQQPIDSFLVILLASIAVLANGLSVLLIKDNTQNDLNMKSAYLHLFSDMLASVAVLVGGILMHVYTLYWIDSLLTFAIACYLIYVSFDLLKESSMMLMLFTPKHLSIKEVTAQILLNKEVNNIHHIHLWQLNENEIHLEAHIDMNNNVKISDFQEIRMRLEEQLKEKFSINHITIQPEFGLEGDKDLIIQD